MTGVPDRSSASRTASMAPARSVNVTWCSRRLHQPRLLLIATRAGRHQQPVLLSRLQAEVLQEALGHRQVRHLERVMVQP